MSAMSHVLPPSDPWRTTRDHILGCIVGGAIGDALGGLPERRNLSLSDDTQLTLATCEALLESPTPSPEIIASTFLRWFQEGALTGLGSSTLKALRDLGAGQHWALAGATGEMAAGNGAAMRAAPLAFALDPRRDRDKTIIRDICRITHRNDEAYVGALAVIAAIRAPAPPSPEILSSLGESLPDSQVRDRILRFSALPVGISLADVANQFGSSGFVVETVPLALLAAGRMTHDAFESTLADLVRSGGDTDTIGAIAGQIAGAHLGLVGIPVELASLAPVKEVLPQAETFALAFPGP
jgi:ADP-ribosyl-[dinitrogen reductase] hydrolase